MMMMMTLLIVMILVAMIMMTHVSCPATSHTKCAKAGQFSVARLKMDLPFHDSDNYDGDDDSRSWRRVE